MSDLPQPPFLKFLENGETRGGFETDDVLAALLPLFRQVLETHEAGFVAPLRGIHDLLVTDQGFLKFAPAKVVPPQKNLSKVEELQAPLSQAVEVVGQFSRTTDVDRGSLQVSSGMVATQGAAITKPAYLLHYESWEHALGHHDELTDIFSLGMLLASIAGGLDFSDPGELEIFVGNRTNLFAVQPRLNPVLASVIVQMTELNRHKRSPDLAQIISRLENYREQPADFDFSRIQGFRESELTGKRRLIQNHLRDRLFEISRRNRLIYFKPTLQTLNLTIASVPLLLDYRNIKLEQLFVWHPQLAAVITESAPISLGKYLRFEDAPYIPGVLDKIISEARHDRAEYGFAQLRLVLCFLRWNNLKEEPNERIHSPLLLMPVDLTKKKGVRDNYVLDPIGSEVEVNPALRHYLRELYNLNLPERFDLRETSLDQFYDTLKAQIQASEPGITLNKIDRPQIELIHERARQRVDQYRRRMKIKARSARSAGKPDYSYDREQMRPLGLQLFLDKVRPSPMPLRDVLGAEPQVRLPGIVETEAQGEAGKVLETEKQMYSLHDGGNQNPYAWDFDLCSITLGNFNYRKMTLVRDYANLIETDTASTAFDTVFSLEPKPAEEAPPPALELAEQHLILPCDAAQASAIARARSGRSYIIQGPPGTGKSQTITNLIADYVARGKRVLFVCEKRAAIDIVFHRLRQQGLDELCCLIHDSQTDKKAFIQNLKQTYEKFLGQPEQENDPDRERANLIAAMEQNLSSLRRFSDAMRQAHEQTGLPLRTLLHRLVELGKPNGELTPQVEDLLPDYPLWLKHGTVIERLHCAMADLGEDLCFAKHPLHWLGSGVLQADRPIEAMSALLEKAEDSLDAIESALELSELPKELWDTFGEIKAILDFSARIRFLAERGLLKLLTDGPESASFQSIIAELEEKSRTLEEFRQKAAGWREPLSADDTQNALELARSLENSIFRFLQPAFWRLRKTLQARYDFTQHAVAPTWSKILEQLKNQHDAQAAFDSLCAKAQKDWQTDDLNAFINLVHGLRADRLTTHPSVRALTERLCQTQEAASLVNTLVDIQARFTGLDQTLRSLLAEHQEFDLPKLGHVLATLRHQSGVLAELLPVLEELVELPDSFQHALRRAPIPLNQFEAAVGHRSLNLFYRLDRAVSRFEGRTMARKMEQLDKHYREWLAINARCIRAAVRRNFLEHVNISSQPASQLDNAQKAFKKTYAAGRRELEHEFGKTMRYKSIRDLAAGDTGDVIQDLKPIWLMSPLSVSDTLPLDPNLFDVVIFDEASQIPVEEAIPAIYRSHQVIVVGDEMQLPPTTFFATSRTEEESVVVEEEGERYEVDLDSDSFLTQSATNLPSTLLAWHYRSRYESLISFSNASFYSGNLFTVPDRQKMLAERAELSVKEVKQGCANVDALLERSISFHFLECGVYTDRRNPAEAAYIAELVRGLLQRQTGQSIGIVAFSEAQQSEIEEALNRLANDDSAFAEQLETEYIREENDQFCGLFVKNLENVQGDERDIIIMSVCYGHDARGRMLMNFGPINQRGGEKRLNVIFSRSKHHMALVSSIRHFDITNDYNEGANNLKNFLQYAEAVSKGNETMARRVLENLNPLARKALAQVGKHDAVVEQLAEALRARGYVVDLAVGQSKFRCDLAVRKKEDPLYQLGILIDTEAHYASPNLLDRYLMQPGILRAFGWRYALVLTKDWYHTPDDVLNRLERLLKGEREETEAAPAEEEPVEDQSVVLEKQEEKVLAPVAQPIEQPPIATSNLATPPPVLEPVAASTEPSAVRYFEFIGGASRKFWEISLSGNSFTVRFGRIGTSGQTQTKTFAEEKKAKAEAEKLITEKVRKGYIEKDLGNKH